MQTEPDKQTRQGNLDPPRRRASLWRDAWRRLRRNRMALAGLAIFAVLGSACVLGPWLSPYSYSGTDLGYGAQAPSARHWFGTDTLAGMC